ncbi:FtsB family cell division protein [Paenibacillus sp. 1P07SE]|uniref:FtsB family cell division protein n=1 Tax=Paenibacillus sp. 1P07SE TaxID=3132209 RepID=UPI0039A5B0F7
MAATGNKQTAYAGTKRRLKLWFIAVSLFMGWAVYTMVGQSGSQAETQSKLMAIEQQLEASEQKSAELQQKMERLNDAEYIQEIARKQYGLIKPGERPIQVTVPEE